MRFIYSLLLYILYPLFYIKLKKRFGKVYFKERKSVSTEGDFDYLVHGASVGEQVLIYPLVKHLAEKGKKILLTAATDTGLNKAIENFNSFENVKICYFPFDLYFSVKLFFKRLNIEKLVLVETELWPNSILEAHKKGAKIYLINGIISDNSLNSYRKLRFIFKEIFKRFEKVMVRSKIDAERFKEIGCPANIIKVCGNLKLVNKPVLKNAMKIESECPIVVFGSTRDGEEEIILKAVRHLIIEGEITPIFVPRHIERVKEIENLLKENKLNYVLSEKKDSFSLKRGEVLLVNETGRLISFYKIADLCFVGGSLVDFGGQNFVEPLFFNKVTVTGKYLSNFEDLRELLEDFFFRVENSKELRFFIENFLNSMENFKKKVEGVDRVLRENTNSLNCILEELI